VIGKILIWTAVGVAAWEVGWYGIQLAERRKAYHRAVKAAKRRGKPLLVVGNPHGQYGCGDVTLDIEPSTECPNHVTSSVETLPFSDKHFGAAFVSSVIEHSCQPYAALRELNRVADSIYVTYPWWWRLTTLLTPGHAWIVTKRDDGSLKFTPWRKACNVPGYFGTGGDGEVRPYVRVRDFDRALQVGDRVAARWTWGFGQWCDTGTVVKLNPKSVRVRLDHGVDYGVHGTGGGLPSGHVVLVPRAADRNKWTWNNGVFPPEC